MKECPLSGVLSEELFLQNLVAILDRNEPELIVSRNERYSVCVFMYVCVCVHIPYVLMSALGRTVSCPSCYGNSRKKHSSSH